MQFMGLQRVVHTCVTELNRSPLEWPGWISLQSKGLSRVLSNTTVQKHQYQIYKYIIVISPLSFFWGFPGGAVEENLPAMQEMQEMRV